MVVQQFQILFDDPFATYKAGQMVTGKMVAKILQPMRIRGIELRFRGEAKVSWSEKVYVRNRDGRIQPYDEPYIGNEIYFENHFFVLGSPSDDMTLEPGDCMYGFSMLLPPKLPPSFEGKYGHVRYTLESIVHSVGQSRPISTIYFTVLSHLDLNQIPAVQVPVRMFKDKYLCCCYCKTGPITVTVSLPLRGFVPNQHIPLSVEVDNNTGKTLPIVVCFLRKEVVFATVRPRKKTRSTKNVVSELVLGAAGPNISCTWNEKMLVPNLPPSVMESCGIIHTNYSILVYVRVPGFHSNINLSVPITIGTVPVANSAVPALGPPR